MDSYVVSCKYAEPQFPPCEEDYSNFTDQGGYYNNPQDSGSYAGGYQPMQPPPPPYTPQQTGYQHSLQGHHREDGEDHSQHQGATYPVFRETDAPGKERFPVSDLQCQAWMTCAKPAQVQRKTACQGKDKPPIVVYPWMKKVHVAHGEINDNLKIQICSALLQNVCLISARFMPNFPRLCFVLIRKAFIFPLSSCLFQSLSLFLSVFLFCLSFSSICEHRFCCRVIYDLSESQRELQPL